MRSGAFVMPSDCVRHCPVIYGRLWTIRGRVNGCVGSLLGVVHLPAHRCPTARRCARRRSTPR